MNTLDIRDELPALRDLVACALMASEAIPDARPLSTLLDLVETRLGALIDVLEAAAADDAA